jgi:CRISPR-associated protein Csm1
MEERMIRLAARLHDIGKFWQGTGERGKNAGLSSRFIQEHVPEQGPGAAGIVARHHDPKARRSDEFKALKTIVCADLFFSDSRVIAPLGNPK